MAAGMRGVRTWGDSVGEAEVVAEATFKKPKGSVGGDCASAPVNLLKQCCVKKLERAEQLTFRGDDKHKRLVVVLLRNEEAKAKKEDAMGELDPSYFSRLLKELPSFFEGECSADLKRLVGCCARLLAAKEDEDPKMAKWWVKACVYSLTDHQTEGMLEEGVKGVIVVGSAEVESRAMEAAYAAVVEAEASIGASMEKPMPLLAMGSLWEVRMIIFAVLSVAGLRIKMG